ncbi:MAG: hypothetical protein M1818_004446 [Claussenomyces sp. TS43310]|nr:MAG: hypothetical protein M1818_004446 [Claussenomyces sp. TS43310]
METKPYKGVYVLAVHWSNDKIGVGPLEDGVCRTFAIVYRYTVEKYIIDATLSQYDTRKAFRKRMDKFTEDYNRPGNLLIVVYSGHAAHIASSGQFLLVGDLDKRSNLAKPTLDWNEEVSPRITDTVADVLVILNCCYASSIAVDDRTGPEILAASAWQTLARAALSTSFTQNLIDEFKRLNGKPASVASIYTQISSFVTYYILLRVIDHMNCVYIRHCA